MIARIQMGALNCAEDWEALFQGIKAPFSSRDIVSDDKNLFLKLLNAFESLGAKSFIFESTYIDRDFSAAYSAFYASLFHHYPISMALAKLIPFI